jgi:hypothetical protein
MVRSVNPVEEKGTKRKQRHKQTSRRNRLARNSKREEGERVLLVRASTPHCERSRYEKNSISDKRKRKEKKRTKSEENNTGWDVGKRDERQKKQRVGRVSKPSHNFTFLMLCQEIPV